MGQPFTYSELIGQKRFETTAQALDALLAELTRTAP
jgi:hypothetical protein